MDGRSITINKSGYDPFIDFLKAYSIICVIIAHILPSSVLYKYFLFHVWGDMQVPMFVLIQVFHAYKKGTQPRLNRDGLFKRICLPFLVVQGVIVLFKALIGEFLWKDLVFSGGLGPGSYYIWVYIQMALLLIIIWPWVKRVSFDSLLVAFLILSICIEVLFSMIELPDRLYRLLCVRYLFLIPLSLLWIEKGILLNRKTVLLSILSIVAVIFFFHTNYDLEPFFFNTGWKTHRWICYFYIPVLLTYGLYIVWNRIQQLQMIVKIVKWTATRSYEIFLSQMAVLACFPFAYFSYILSGVIGYSIWVIVAFSLSLFFGGVIYRFRKIVLK